jgi:dolichol-phosphate mannosyltransferase
MDLSLVIPVRNEQPNVAPLVAEIRAALDGRLDYEVIYVDDSSTDDTPERLAELSRDFPRLRAVRHQRNCGQSAALLTGVRLARAPWVATLDGDGQNDPADIPAMLATLRGQAAGPDRSADGLQLVCGHRRKRMDSVAKRFSSRVANAVRGRLLRDRTPDTGCGLKLFSREAFLALPHFDHMHRFLPALIIRSGGRVVSTPVAHRPRLRGRSHYGMFDRLWVGIVDLLGVMWLTRRAKRSPVIELTAKTKS